jgi:3-methyladenine DNA glycosylase AlkC
MEPLKEMFNKQFFEKLAKEFQSVQKTFEAKQFVSDAMSGIGEMELNARMRNTSLILKKHLPQNFETSVELMKRVIPNMKAGYANLVFPDFVGLYGRDDIEFSLDALKYFTCFGSSEFAIREFLKLDFDTTISKMQQWASDSNHHVRRLASEGSRPRLPWSFKLDRVISNPDVTFPILEKLKDDAELYVRKSVANHLNDISKDNPDFVLTVIKNWKGNSEYTNWIIKHGSRTLLKKGNKTALAQFGTKHHPDIIASAFSIVNTKIKTGGKVDFAFCLRNKNSKPVKVRLEYAVYFKIASGAHSKKVFKISERQVQGGEQIQLKKAHSFKPITTRRYYPGEHKIALIVNGKELAAKTFELKK